MDDAAPGIVVPADWRSEVAAWPPDQWVAWRRRAKACLFALGRPATADEIRRADRQSFLDLSRASAECEAIQAENAVR